MSDGAFTAAKAEIASQRAPFTFRNMNFRVVLFLVAIHCCNAFAQDCPETPFQIAKAIQLNVAHLRAAEYCRARVLATEGSITAVVYTAEGACQGFNSSEVSGTCTNQWDRYLVALVEGHVTPPVKVGGKGGLLDQKMSLSNGVVEITGLTIGPNDPMCCPTVPLTKRFKISAGR